MFKYINGRNIILTCLFSTLLVLGLSIHRDFGMGVDEPIERNNGMISLSFIADQFSISKLQSSEFLKPFRSIHLENYKDRDYPVLFNLPAAFFEWVFKIEDEQEIYWFRHLLNYCVCLCGVFAIFRLAERRFESWKLGILAVILFVTSPRFFAESFFNSKDLVFLAFFAITTNTMVAFLIKPSMNTALKHSLATALAINVRIMGIIFLLATFLVLLIKLCKREIDAKRFLVLSAVYFICAAVITYCLWPWLWGHPIERMIEGFENMAHFRLAMSIPYLGQTISSTRVPWHYVPVYVAITTPVLYSFFFIAGFTAVIYSEYRLKLSVWGNNAQLQDFIFIGLFLGPIIAVIALNSVLYNSWRQMYFIYTIFLMLVLRGIIQLWDLFEKKKGFQRFLRTSISFGIFLTVMGNVIWMIKVHPFQHLYFNFLAGKNWERKFESDYWALTHQKALRLILDNDNRPVIKVAGVWQDVLPKVERARIAKVDFQFDADYLVEGSGANFFKLDEILVDEKVINTISKRRGDIATLDPIFVNEKVFFGKSKKGVQYLLAVGNQSHIGWGWSHPEDWGVWSDGYQAKLLLTVPNHSVQRLNIVIHPFTSTKQPTQNVKVFINRHHAGDYLLSATESTISIPLGKNMVDRNYLEVLFQLQNAVSPRELDIGNDDRKLAIGLVSVCFE